MGRAGQATIEVADAELVALAVAEPAGDAFRVLFERHQRAVYRFALAITREEQLADDALQETFLRVYQHAERFDPRRPFRPWLYRIARNVALDLLRARAKLRAKQGDELERVCEERVAESASRAEAARDVRGALHDLDDDTRALLIERHGVGLKLTELAEARGCTERTVRNHLHAAVAALTEALLRRRGGCA